MATLTSLHANKKNASTAREAEREHPLRRRLRVAFWAVASLLLGTSAPRAWSGPTQLYNDGDPTAAEQYMLQLVNRARADPAAEAARFGIDLNEGLAPGTITTDPKPPLACNVHLLQSARAHSLWMLEQDQFSHYEGTADPGDRMTAAGYVFSGTWIWGENIAWRGTTGPTPPIAPTLAQEHEDLFVDSGEPGRGHRLNLMDARFREVGIGAETGVFTTGGQNYNAVMSTQDFASSGANPGPFLVGVVYRDSDKNGFYTVGEGSSGVTIMPALGTYYAVSSTSGGYAIPITGLSGTLQVTFSGGPLAAPVTKSVALTGTNMELDFELNHDAATPLEFVAGSARFSSGGRFDVDLRGPAGAQVTIHATSDWQNVVTAGSVVLTNGFGHFTDNPPAGTPRQFYWATIP